MPESFLRRIARGETVLADGAWGTLLIERGLEAGACPETVTLDDPRALLEIAGAYLEAGAEILTTNTFGASPLKLRARGLEHEATTFNRRAVELLRTVAGDGAWVAGSMGPTGAILEPYGDALEDDLRVTFCRQAEALAEGGADLISIETMTDLREAEIAVRAAKSVAAELPVSATMSFESTPRGFFTIMGASIANAAEGLAGAGADVVGSNCGNGSEAMIEIASEMVAVARVPVAIRPNAGAPTSVGGRPVYPETPALLAAAALRLAGLGVAVVGGCCGTGPDHVRAMRRALAGERA